METTVVYEFNRKDGAKVNQTWSEIDPAKVAQCERISQVVMDEPFEATDLKDSNE